MPSLTPKRIVTYTKADWRAIEQAQAVIEFMGEFDRGVKPGEFAATINGLRNAADWIRAQRNGTAKDAKPQPAPQEK